MKMKYEDVMKSIINNHNHSWYHDIRIRNEKNMQDTAIFFRGTQITYAEFFSAVFQYAKALKAYGISKGDDFVTCLRQTPDYPILVAAASLIGAKIVLAASDFHKDYLAELINNAKSEIVLVADWEFAKMEDTLAKLHIDKKIVVLPVSNWDKNNNPNAAITDKYFRFDKSAFEAAVARFNNVISFDEFIANGEGYAGEVDGNAGLDEDLSVTFTSGSTKKGYHKGVVHKNKSYIVMGRYHDPEVAGIPKMKNTITYSPIGIQADTLLMTVVSDTLMQGGTIALDPITDEEYFLYGMKINNGGLVVATRSYWIRAMKETYKNPENKGLTLPGLYVPSEGGEPLTMGEEYALNKWLKDVKAGIAITHTPFSIVKMSVGGGDTEQGSIFLTLFRGYYRILQKLRGLKEPIGLTPYDFAEIAILREDGTYCDAKELGNVVCNAATAMDRYYNNPDETSNYYITDAHGKRWGDLHIYGYMDKWGKVYIKGRIGANDLKVKTFEVADVISRDFKHVMSCEVITTEEDDVKYVAHIEPQFHDNVDIDRLVKRAKKRCLEEFGQDIEDRLYFRIRNFDEGFPTLFTTKRNIHLLKTEGISDKCIR